MGGVNENIRTFYIILVNTLLRCNSKEETKHISQCISNLRSVVCNSMQEICKREKEDGASRHQIYLLLSPPGDSAPSMHLSSWLATICRSSSSSRVSRSNWSSYGKTFTAAIIARHPPWHSNLSLLFKTYLMPLRIKCKTHFVFSLHDLTDFSVAVSSLRDCSLF